MQAIPQRWGCWAGKYPSSRFCTSFPRCRSYSHFQEEYKWIILTKQKCLYPPAFSFPKNRFQPQEAYVWNIRVECLKHSPSMFETFPKDRFEGMKGEVGHTWRNKEDFYLQRPSMPSYIETSDANLGTKNGKVKYALI